MAIGGDMLPYGIPVDAIMDSERQGCLLRVAQQREPTDRVFRLTSYKKE
jgi:hypothetical protein